MIRSMGFQKSSTTASLPLPRSDAVLRDVERRQMMLGRDVANRLRLAVNELGAELDRNFEVRLMLREDPAAEARAGFEHGDATAFARGAWRRRRDRRRPHLLRRRRMTNDRRGEGRRGHTAKLTRAERAERPSPNGRAVVGESDAREQRARSRSRRVHVGRSAANCEIAQAFGRAQPAAKGGSVSVGNVDADVLRQPGRGKPVADAATRARAREGGAQARVWPRLAAISSANGRAVRECAPLSLRRPIVHERPWCEPPASRMRNVPTRFVFVRSRELVG